MTGSAPLVLRAILLAVLVLLGLPQVRTGYRGLRRRLPRSRFAGVRTSATMRSDRAFELANQVAGLPIVISGFVGVAGGALQFFAPTTALTVVITIVTAVGMVGITTAASLRGHRAAAMVPAPDYAVPTSNCGGTCGCCTN